MRPRAATSNPSAAIAQPRNHPLLPLALLPSLLPSRSCSRFVLARFACFAPTRRRHRRFRVRRRRAAARRRISSRGGACRSRASRGCDQVLQHDVQAPRRHSRHRPSVHAVRSSDGVASGSGLHHHGVHFPSNPTPSHFPHLTPTLIPLSCRAARARPTPCPTWAVCAGWPTPTCPPVTIGAHRRDSTPVPNNRPCKVSSDKRQAPCALPKRWW